MPINAPVKRDGIEQARSETTRVATARNLMPPKNTRREHMGQEQSFQPLPRRACRRKNDFKPDRVKFCWTLRLWLRTRLLPWIRNVPFKNTCPPFEKRLCHSHRVIYFLFDFRILHTSVFVLWRLCPQLHWKCF